jgi:hypothetical protein
MAGIRQKDAKPEMIFTAGVKEIVGTHEREK